MKIGIVTQPILDNYGCALQNFALQHTLRRLGHQPVTIDFIPQMSLYRYLKNRLKTRWHNLRNSAKKPLPQSRDRRPRHPYFEAFVARHISTTPRVGKYTRRVAQHEEFEAVITGSDQVWRPRYNPHTLHNMYLDFAPRGVIRLSYAASFGVDTWEYKSRQEQQCRGLAKQLHGVSVREAEGVDLCRRFLGVDAVEVLDPTLLLTADDYLHVCADVPRATTPYIAAYILDLTPEAETFIRAEAERRGAEVRIFGTGERIEYSVEEWLALFRDAECVITDSFHGSVFSIIFRKEFVSIVNRQRGASRFHSLLGKFALTERIIDPKNDQMPAHRIDWTLVENRLREWQQHSIDFITNTLCPR